MRQSKSHKDAVVNFAQVGFNNSACQVFPLAGLIALSSQELDAVKADTVYHIGFDPHV